MERANPLMTFSASTCPLPLAVSLIGPLALRSSSAKRARSEVGPGFTLRLGGGQEVYGAWKAFNLGSLTSLPPSTCPLAPAARPKYYGFYWGLVED